MPSSSAISWTEAAAYPRVLKTLAAASSTSARRFWRRAAPAVSSRVVTGIPLFVLWVRQWRPPRAYHSFGRDIPCRQDLGGGGPSATLAERILGRVASPSWDGPPEAMRRSAQHR